MKALKVGIFMVPLFLGSAVLAFDAGQTSAFDAWKLKKGSLSIEGNKVESRGNLLIAAGEAVAAIGEQDARLEADQITFDKSTRTIEASGNTRLFRKGFQRKADSIKFSVEDAKFLVTSADTTVSEPKIHLRIKIGAAVPGTSRVAPTAGLFLARRQAAFNEIKKLGTRTIANPLWGEFQYIEQLIKGGAPESQIDEQLTQLQNLVSGGDEVKKIGFSRQTKAIPLDDQFYGNGPLTKLCRLAESRLRSTWIKTPAFAKFAYAFCIVDQDGKISQLEMDAPDKYSDEVKSITFAAIKALNLKAPTAKPVPLVICVGNAPEDMVVYVRGISFDRYMAALEPVVKRNWHPPVNSGNKRTDVRFDILRTGQIKAIEILESSGDDAFDKSAIAAVTAANPVSAFPDGSHAELNVAFAFDYRTFSGGAK